MAAGVVNVGDIIVDRYKLVEEIGRGGFGVVFRAVQLGMDRPVAVKVLHPAGNEELQVQMRERFKREAMMARNLNHPHTIRQYDFGEIGDGTMFLVLEYLEGRNLVEVIRQDGKLGDDRVRAIAPGILKSLAEAHAQGIVHRDLKPGNIMLCDVYGERDYVKVLDFGIAKTMMGDTDLTAAGVALGSPRYMPPELLRGDNPVAGSDVYSISITLGEAIIGAAILKTENSVEAAQAQLSPKRIPIPEELRRSSLWPWLSIGFCKEIDQRYQSADEMLRFLNAPLHEIIARGGDAPFAEEGDQTSDSTIPRQPPITDASFSSGASPSVEVSEVEDEEENYAATMRLDASVAIAALEAGAPIFPEHTLTEESDVYDPEATSIIDASSMDFRAPGRTTLPLAPVVTRVPSGPALGIGGVDDSEEEDDEGATQMVELPADFKFSHPGTFGSPAAPVADVVSPAALAPTASAPGQASGPSMPFTPSTPFQNTLGSGPSMSDSTVPMAMGHLPLPTAPPLQGAPTGESRTEFIEFVVPEPTQAQQKEEKKWGGVIVILSLLFVLMLAAVAVVLVLLAKSQGPEDSVIAPPVTLPVPIVAEPPVIEKPPEIEFRIYSIPEGAAVFVDGVEKAKTPARVLLGSDVLPKNGEIRLEGFETQDFKLEPGQTTVELKLSELMKIEVKPVEVKDPAPKPKPKPRPKPKPKPKPNPNIIPLFD